MAQRLSCKSCSTLLAAVILFLAGQRGDAQSPGQPSSPDKVGTLPEGALPAPKPSGPPAAAKELSAQEIDGLIEKAFGRDCPELKRPIRHWLADVGMVNASAFRGLGGLPGSVQDLSRVC